jgi:hypothetical protein
MLSKPMMLSHHAHSRPAQTELLFPMPCIVAQDCSMAQQLTIPP